MGLPDLKSKNKLQYGDYQTPRDFCDKIVSLIANEYNPTYVFEPTFGEGHFLDACRDKFKNDATFYGDEINTEYFKNYKYRKLENTKLYNEDIFNFDHSKIIKEIGQYPLLIIGNPPWATNTKLSKEDSKNLPKKRKHK